MTRDENEAAIRERIRHARETAGLTQADVAQGLGIEADAYRKYETRSLMPISLVGQFCIITGADLDMIVFDRRRAAVANSRKANSSSLTVFKLRAQPSA